MPVEPTRLQYLLQQYAANNCTKQEVLELFQAIKDAQDDEALETSLHHVWQNINESDSFPDLDREKLFSNIMSAAPPVTKRLSIVWIKTAAAAAIVIIVTGWILYAWLHTGKKPEQIIVAARNNFKNDVAPGGNKAILTLSDGSTIILDSAHNGSLAQQGATSVNKLNNGQLEYKAIAGGQSAAVTYNTLVVPRGGQYQVILPDGTKVWLNAASSLKYPTLFTGNERQVVLSGEAYFEVAHSKKVPFIVDITPEQGRKGGRVEVLGTHFNIMAYPDEEGIKTTLLEGKVKVSQSATANGQEAILQPRQQAVLNNSSDVKVIDNINTDEVVAWKNGLFDFRSADIHAVMRQLSRWYNIDINYSAEAKDRFYAKIPRDTRLSDVLQALTMTGKIHFEVDGKKVTVLP